MFQKYHFYYRILHANKLVSRTYSIWQKSPNIFGNQFSHIQNRNGHCNILIKSQQLCLCQRNQFCSGNDEGMQIFLPTESANSSVTISSPETTTNNATEQKEQRQLLSREILETRLLELGNGRQLRLNFEKGRNAFEAKKLQLIRFLQYFHFTNIFVPEDAYAFVRTLDELIGELAAENFEQKLQTQDTSQSMIVVETGSDGQPQNILKLKTVKMTGQRHKFHLELLLFLNEHEPNGQKSICLRLISFSETTKQKRFTILSLLALPWLRKQMAEMLTKYDGTEEIEMEILTKIPKQFFKGSISNFKNPTNNDHFLALETRLLEFGNHYHKKQLRLKLEKGTSGQKFFAITLLTNATGQYKHLDFRNIPIPHDGYAFVRAFDELIGELAAENFEQKYQIQDILKLTEGANNADDDQFRYKFELRSVEVIGRHHKFHVELVLFSNVHKPNGQICLLLNSFNETTKRKGTLYLPLRALPWLRNQMAEMLAKYDGTEEIGKEAPAQIPQKFLINAMSAKITNKDSTEQLDPTMAKIEERIRALFDFDDEDMENYKRIAAKIKYPYRDNDFRD